jgi:hypothetical protein
MLVSLLPSRFEITSIVDRPPAGSRAAAETHSARRRGKATVRSVGVRAVIGLCHVGWHATTVGLVPRYDNGRC